MKRTLTLLACSLWPAVAAAHPGHGTVEPSSPAHYLLEPAHAAVAAFAFAAAVVVGRVVRGRRKGRREQHGVD